MNKKKNIGISVLTFLICIFVVYFVTDIGFRKEIMPISGVPLWLGSLILCIITPIYTYFDLQDKNKKTSKKQFQTNKMMF